MPKFYDCGQIPFKGLAFEIIQKLDPNAKMLKGNVKLDGVSLVSYSDQKPAVCKDPGGQVRGNIYEFSQEIINYISRLGLLTTQTISGEHCAVQMPSVISAGTGLKIAKYRNIKEFALKTTNNKLKFFSDAALNKIKASELQRAKKASKGT